MWLPFNGTRLAAEWDAPHHYGVELYDHSQDSGLDFDSPAEWINVANQTAYQQVQQGLHQLLRSNMQLPDAVIDKRNAMLPGFPCDY